MTRYQQTRLKERDMDSFFFFFGEKVEEWKAGLILFEYIKVKTLMSWLAEQVSVLVIFYPHGSYLPWSLSGPGLSTSDQHSNVRQAKTTCSDSPGRTTICFIAPPLFLVFPKLWITSYPKRATKPLLFCFSFSHTMWAGCSVAIQGLVGRQCGIGLRVKDVLCTHCDKDHHSSFVFLCFLSETISTHFHLKTQHATHKK